jgi:hypothetical protein
MCYHPAPMVAHGTDGAQRTMRVRRARRDDIAALTSCVGGPNVGRVRALRRLLKTLAADVYVVDRGASVDGVVAVTYRRSLKHGGLLATIDTLATLRSRDTTSQGHEDLHKLVECALSRARRRGCVAIDSTVSSPEALSVLHTRGFAAGPPLLLQALGPCVEAGASQASGEDGER